MAITVKLFQATQVYYKTLGIYPTEPNQKISYNVTTVCILLTMVVDFLSTATYFFVEAETIQEYSDSFYVASSAFNFIVCFCVSIWKMPKILQLIAKYEEFAQRRKYY